MAVLAKKEIKKYLDKDFPNKLVITPLLNPGDQIGSASVDVRIGNEFLIIQRSNLPAIDPGIETNIETDIGKYQQRVRIGFGERFILHPGQFVLGCTLEYISLPKKLTAQVEGRSSWGRLGLIIATATPIAPSFKGVLTLELLNGGLAPLILYPGVKIGQLVISELTSEVEPKMSRYMYPTGPQFSRIYEDDDIHKVWGVEQHF